MKVTRQADLPVPISEIRELWSKFEDYPLFMASVEEIELDGPMVAHWKLGNPEDLTEIETMFSVEGDTFVWSSVDDMEFKVEASLTPTPSGTHLEISVWGPASLFEHFGGDLLGLGTAEAPFSLERFSEYARALHRQSTKL